MMLFSRRQPIARVCINNFLHSYTPIPVNTFSTFVDPNLTPAAAPDTKEYELEIRDVLKRAAIRKERRGCLVGIVVSDKNAKSISIKVDREKYFPKYDAILKRTKKFMAHDENEVCEMGDLVRVVPCRPMSKKKRHVVLDIIRKGNRLDIVLTKEERTRDPNKFY